MPLRFSALPFDSLPLVAIALRCTAMPLPGIAIPRIAFALPIFALPLPFKSMLRRCVSNLRHAMPCRRNASHYFAFAFLFGAVPCHCFALPFLASALQRITSPLLSKSTQCCAFPQHLLSSYAVISLLCYAERDCAAAYPAQNIINGRFALAPADLPQQLAMLPLVHAVAPKVY